MNWGYICMFNVGEFIDGWILERGLRGFVFGLVFFCNVVNDLNEY